MSIPPSKHNNMVPKDDSEQLERSAPTLMGLPRHRDPFVVPERFFSRFPLSVKDRILEQDRRPFGVTLPRLRLAGALVFGMLMIMAATYFLLSRTAFEDQPAELSGTLTSEEWLLYEDSELLLADAAVNEGVQIAGIVDQELAAENVLTFLELDGAYIDELLAEQ
ncbi:MAG: hypothetical protein KDB88_00430 [Flavobacteriales bacterium]|nr:hypothetical protein [Flavobacteriales bacterium]